MPLGPSSDGHLTVDLTKKHIENSPGIETDRPVSDQHQRALHEYYGWPAYWTVAPYPLTGTSVAPVPVPPLRDEPAAPPGDPRLRSFTEVSGYKIHALDGTIGHVEDLLIAPSAWAIRLLVVDTRNWLPGKKVVILPGAIDRVSWSDSAVTVQLSREAIKESPEYSPSAPLPADVEALFTNYYHEHAALR
jgi:hypothetical protein